MYIRKFVCNGFWNALLRVRAISSVSTFSFIVKAWSDRDGAKI